MDLMYVVDGKYYYGFVEYWGFELEKVFGWLEWLEFDYGFGFGFDFDFEFDFDKSLVVGYWLFWEKG